MIRIQEEDFDAGAIIRQLAGSHPGAGAVASFVGLVRDTSENERVSSMTLEHYPGMTEKALGKIVDQAQARWGLLEAAVIHRVGELRPADQIVLVVAAARHRHDAFAACEFIMDVLKTQAPFWKKERCGNKTRWVETRQGDLDAADRWKAGGS
ncbi:MAG: molybdenum cofactor biosynthesis protein MoaE [Gammaproteobacteria bacterium]